MRNAEVIVRAPNYVATAYIEKLIQLKLPWLKEKIAQQIQNPPTNQGLVLEFVDEQLSNTPTILIDGLTHKLDIKFGTQAMIYNREEQRLTVVLSTRYKNADLNSIAVLTKVKSQIEVWFKAHIEGYLQKNLAIFYAQMSLQPSSYKVRKYKARWGSCNNRGELSFNSLLKMVPSSVVDYVIVHELAHLKYMNHSAHFWQLVKQHYPEFQSAKSWLKQHQAVLNWQ